MKTFYTILIALAMVLTTSTSYAKTFKDNTKYSITKKTDFATLVHKHLTTIPPRSKSKTQDTTVFTNVSGCMRSNYSSIHATITTNGNKAEYIIYSNTYFKVTGVAITSTNNNNGKDIKYTVFALLKGSYKQKSVAFEIEDFNITDISLHMQTCTKT